MGEAKRRRLLLKENYGKPETSQHKILQHVQGSLLPDYGSFYFKKFGATPLTLQIQNGVVAVNDTEGTINWIINGCVATLIVSSEFARTYVKNPSQILVILPDSDNTYLTPLGEAVTPFRLVRSDESY